MLVCAGQVTGAKIASSHKLSFGWKHTLLLEFDTVPFSVWFVKFPDVYNPKWAYGSYIFQTYQSTLQEIARTCSMIRGSSGH